MKTNEMISYRAINMVKKLYRLTFESKEKRPNAIPSFQIRV